MQIRIITTHNIFTAEATPEEFSQIVSSIDLSREKVMFHLPENLFPNTYVARQRIVSIELQESGHGTEAEKKDETATKRGRPPKQG